MNLLKLSMVVFGAAVMTTSCLDNDRGPSVRYGNLAVTAVEVPEVINPVGKTTELNVTFATTNSCQSFFDFQAVADNGDNKKVKIAVVGAQRDEGTCQDVQGSGTHVLKFTPQTAGVYTLQFWSGNVDGNSTFITEEVTVPDTAAGQN